MFSQDDLLFSPTREVAFLGHLQMDRGGHLFVGGEQGHSGLTAVRERRSDRWPELYSIVAMLSRDDCLLDTFQVVGRSRTVLQESLGARWQRHLLLVGRIQKGGFVEPDSGC